VKNIALMNDSPDQIHQLFDPRGGVAQPEPGGRDAGMPKRTPSATMRMSQPIASATPPRMRNPRIVAIVGFGHAVRRRLASSLTRS
jgi:hypothetical protein